MVNFELERHFLSLCFGREILRHMAVFPGMSFRNVFSQTE